VPLVGGGHFPFTGKTSRPLWRCWVKCALVNGTSSSTKPPLPVPWQISAFITSALAGNAITNRHASVLAHATRYFLTATPFEWWLVIFPGRVAEAYIFSSDSALMLTACASL